MIPKKILAQYGAKEYFFRKGQVLFQEGTEALYYCQVEQGSVKMITSSASGQEFIQGIFKAGESFGEPPLFGGFSYPSSALAMEDSMVLKLEKTEFFNLLKENFDIHLQLDRVLCMRLKYKSMVLSDISFYDPEQRVMNLLQYLKKNSDAIKMVGPGRHQRSYLVPYTRQQLADMSGMRVETVIRTVKKMQHQGKLEIVGRKIAI